MAEGLVSHEHSLSSLRDLPATMRLLLDAIVALALTHAHWSSAVATTVSSSACKSSVHELRAWHSSPARAP